MTNHHFFLNHSGVDDDFVIDDITGGRFDSLPVKSQFQFSVSVETPVMYFPRDLSGLELIVCNLGKITASNTFHPAQRTSEGNQEMDRVTLEIQKINLSVIKLSSYDIENLNVQNRSLHSIIGQQDSNQIQIIHNTDLFLQADKLYTYDRFTQLMNNSFRLVGRVNSALKLFLSVPTYQQILSTVQFACDMKGEIWTPSPSSVSLNSDSGSSSAR